MKGIAFFILIVFTLVQAAPAIQSLIKLNNEIVFNIDEEKTGENTDTNEKKEKKDFSLLSLVAKAASSKVSITFHLAEKIYLSPCLEKLTPPPNFC